MSLVDYQPDPAASPKPEMPRRTANWHAHVAGMRASEAAENSGADPAAVEALCARPRDLGGLVIPPLTMATFWALRDVAKAGDITGIESQMISLMAFMDPDAVRAAAKRKDIAWLEEEAYQLAARLTPAQFSAVGKHIAAQMALVETLGGNQADDTPPATAGKPPTASTPES